MVVAGLASLWSAAWKRSVFEAAKRRASWASVPRGFVSLPRSDQAPGCRFEEVSRASPVPWVWTSSTQPLSEFFALHAVFAKPKSSPLLVFCSMNCSSLARALNPVKAFIPSFCLKPYSRPGLCFHRHKLPPTLVLGPCC